MKTYRNRIAGSNFIDKTGRVHEFLGGSLTTDDPELIEELDKIADKAASLIYTTAKPLEVMAEVQPVNEIQARAAQVIKELEEANKVKG